MQSPPGLFWFLTSSCNGSIDYDYISNIIDYIVLGNYDYLRSCNRLQSITIVCWSHIQTRLEILQTCGLVVRRSHEVSFNLQKPSDGTAFRH